MIVYRLNIQTDHDGTRVKWFATKREAARAIDNLPDDERATVHDIHRVNIPTGVKPFLVEWLNSTSITQSDNG